jgi:hypothetical protein
MSGLFLPAELTAILLAFGALVLGVLFAFPERFRLRSPGSRVTALRLAVGTILAVDATLQFLPGASPQVAYLLVVGAGQDQASLAWWYSYWAGVIAQDPGFWWYGTGVLTASLATCLILGVARRIAYVVGFAFGLGLWAIPNGFGGPFVAPNTDVGGGLLYALLFLILLQADSVSGPARLVGDGFLEHRWPRWRLIGGASFSPRPTDDTHDRGDPVLLPIMDDPSADRLSLTSTRPGMADRVAAGSGTDGPPSVPAESRQRRRVEVGPPTSGGPQTPQPSTADRK